MKGRKRTLDVEHCTRCGKEMYRPPNKRKYGRPFCSRQCHMKTINEELNPERMIPATRVKLRRARLNSGAGTSYEKFLGRHTHRVVAELMLGRPLACGEVVHHIDGNKRNNNPENLMIFSSQAEHAAWHAAHEGGGAE